MDRLTDRLDMTIVVDWDIKQHSNKQTMYYNDTKILDRQGGKGLGN